MFAHDNVELFSQIYIHQQPAGDKVAQTIFSRLLALCLLLVKVTENSLISISVIKGKEGF